MPDSVLGHLDSGSPRVRQETSLRKTGWRSEGTCRERRAPAFPWPAPYLHQAACHPGSEAHLEVEDDPVARQDVDTGDLPEDLEKVLDDDCPPPAPLKALGLKSHRHHSVEVALGLGGVAEGDDIAALVVPHEGDGVDLAEVGEP